MKSQVLADFLIEHPCFDKETHDNNNYTPWEKSFNGSFTLNGTVAGVVIVSPMGNKWKLEVTLHGSDTNDKVEYEALIVGLEKLVDLEAINVRILRDSQLVINQVNGLFKCKSLPLSQYIQKVEDLFKHFQKIECAHVLRDQNQLAQFDSSYNVKDVSAFIEVERSKRTFYAKDAIFTAEFDQQRVLLKCLGADDALLIMAEVHEENCVTYAKGYKTCQHYGQISRVPANDLNPIVKPWPFHGWTMDMISEITPPSSKGHMYVVVITDYFTKWVEANPFKTVKMQDLVDFLKGFIFICFVVSESVTMDQAHVFNGPAIQEFTTQYGVQLLNSSAYYAQANGQAESTNKLIKAGISKMIADNPRVWNEKLLDTLWAYRISRGLGGVIGYTPYQLIFGHVAVIQAEVNVESARILYQNSLDLDSYSESMNIPNLDVEHLKEQALTNLLKNKIK
ncbi:uncharacterized protein LOC141632897 [Silene latifolia]|uniref:uncharacterized protein LOC141632897 n=1 Tax=Silene latifolia TaxID=37657 RepID=UPI003D782D87